MLMLKLLTVDVVDGGKGSENRSRWPSFIDGIDLKTAHFVSSFRVRTSMIDAVSCSPWPLPTLMMSKGVDC